MHGFVLLFPWFSVSRDPVTFVAHIVFGVVAASSWFEGLQATRRLR